MQSFQSRLQHIAKQQQACECNSCPGAETSSRAAPEEARRSSTNLRSANGVNGQPPYVVQDRAHDAGPESGNQIRKDKQQRLYVRTRNNNTQLELRILHTTDTGITLTTLSPQCSSYDGENQATSTGALLEHGG